jgi:RES domain-containing protein
MRLGFRITKASHAGSAFDGEGARRNGGRWNGLGTAVVYTAQSQSLAALELLVHLQASHLLASYVSIAAEFADSLVEIVEPARVSRRWREHPPPSALQRFGDRWAVEQRSAVLQVPSAIVPSESNYLLNPRHPDFGEIALGTPKPFDFDRRLR